MTTFVLVHGSSGGGWCWQRLAPILERGGHRVYRPTLTGTGERSHLLSPSVDLSTHITDVERLLFYEDIHDAVLVGHSYSGMVITGVAQRVPERLSRLIYLDAYVPEPGESRWDLLPPEVVGIERSNVDPHGGTGPKPPVALFVPDDPPLAAWIDARLTPHPAGSYRQPLPTDPLPPVPGAFIECTEGQSRFASSAARASARGWPVLRLARRHFSILTHPEEVAALLLQLSLRVPDTRAVT